MPQTIAVLGAYASLPAPEHVREYYTLLGQDARVRGLELPYRDTLVDDGEAAFLAQLPEHWDRHVVTAIPGTMVRAWADPAFGLASTSAQGRADALAFVRGLRDAVEALNTAASRRVVACVEVHSAPPGPHGVAHSAEAFSESLSTLLDLDWGGATLLVEHCDAWIANNRGEKRMLTLDDELDVLRTIGHPELRMSLNWGRSALEGRSAATALEHVRTARAAGVLEGVTFSGAGPVDTPYAKAWMDGHLPLDVDEPGSVMTAAEVRSCAEAALAAGPGPAVSYLGAKCQVPAAASLEERASMLSRILDATEAF